MTVTTLEFAVQNRTDAKFKSRNVRIDQRISAWKQACDKACNSSRCTSASYRVCRATALALNYLQSLALFPGNEWPVHAPIRVANGLSPYWKVGVVPVTPGKWVHLEPSILAITD